MIDLQQPNFKETGIKTREIHDIKHHSSLERYIIGVSRLFPRIKDLPKSMKKIWIVEIRTFEFKTLNFGQKMIFRTMSQKSFFRVKL